MQESQEDTNSDKVLILPLSEDSKKITQALSNDKAMKVLETLTDQAQSASDVAQNLAMPLTTVKYNIDSLVEADLLKVKETKWSKKGREIKIYEPVQKFIVVAPGSMKKDKNSVLNMLKKYLGVVAGALFAATGLEMLTRNSNFGLRASQMQEPMAAKSFDEMAAPMLYENAPNEVFSEEMMADVYVEDAPQADIMGDLPQEEMFDAIPMEEMEMPVSDVPESGIADIPESAVSAYSPNDTLDSGTGMASDIYGRAGSGEADTLSQIPADGVAVASDQTTGFLSELLSHVSVWFLFGCLFIIALLITREVYYRKKNI
ncbi:helix-turn-helix domain-containing protein [Methanolobus sp. ZRKC3]|uniref:ArsR/SmtB family transcription factor n=1 Tax=Methanolobus sp. ZRKC3 TaxID=3125786 RepID=UPI003251BC20